MKNHIMIFMAAVVVCLAFLPASGQTTYVAPYIELSNDAGPPDTIWRKDSGKQPDSTSVRLRVDAFGGSLTYSVPLDVVLLTDNSGSMDERDPGDRDTIGTVSRIQGTYNACIDFIDEYLRAETDQVAHMRFCARVDTPAAFTDDFTFLKAQIDTNVNGKQTIDGVEYAGTAVWSGIYRAVIYAMENRRKGQIPVIIAMTDGEDNASYEDGDWRYSQNASFFLGKTQQDAVDSLIRLIDSYEDSVRIFTINLANHASESYMQMIADTAHGDWAYSADGTDLTDIYAGIGEVIRKLAAQQLDPRVPLIIDALPPYVEYLNNWRPSSENTCQIDSVLATTNTYGITELQFFVPNINVDDTFEVEYDIKCTQSGNVAINYGEGSSNPSHDYSYVIYYDYQGIQAHKDYFPTQYLYVADTLMADSFYLSAVGSDTDKIDVTFNLDGAAAMLLDTLYLYYDTTGWVTSTAGPDMAIPYSQLLADPTVTISGLAKYTLYYFTCSGRNILGERTAIDTALGATATTKAGGAVFITGLSADRNADGYLDKFTLTMDEPLAGDTVIYGAAGFTVSFTAGGVNHIGIDSVQILGSQSKVILYGTNNGTATASPYVRNYQDSGDRPTITYNGTGPLVDLDGFETPAQSIQVADGAGPVLMKAEYDPNGTIGQVDDDVLYVYFSENISDTTWQVLPTAAALLQLVGSGTFGTDAVITTGTTADDNLIEVHFGSSGSEVAVLQDSIKLRPNIVEDLRGNTVSLSGPGLVIMLKGGGALMILGTTADSDGDGYLDRFNVTFSENLQNNGTYTVATGFTVNNRPNLTIDSVVFAAGTPDAVIYLTNSLAASQTGQLRPDQDSEDAPVLRYDSTGVVRNGSGAKSPIHTIPLADRAGPVISMAEYDDNGTAGTVSDDILTITFSEPVSDVSWQAAGGADAVFTITGSGSFGASSIVTGLTANDHIVQVQMAAGATKVNAFSDSVRIRANRLTDAAGVVSDAANRAILVTAQEQLSVKIEGFPATVAAGQVVDGYTISVVNQLDTVIAISDSVQLIWRVFSGSGDITSPYGYTYEVPDSIQYLNAGILTAAAMDGDLKLVSAVSHSIQVGIMLPNGTTVWSDTLDLNCIPGSGYKAEIRDGKSTVRVLPDTFFVAPEVTFTLYAGLHDYYGNHTGDIIGTWSSAGLNPAVTGTDSLVQHAFLNEDTGTVMIDVPSYIDDTLVVAVRYFDIQELDSLVIVDQSGAEVGNRNLTTDDDGLLLYPMGYDDDGHMMGRITSVWGILGGGATVFPATGDSAYLSLTSPGTTWVTATANGISDTTGMLFVTAGQAYTLIITPDSVGLTADDSVRFIVVAVDADGNPTSDLGTLTWSTTGDITGTFVQIGDTVIFYPVKSGDGQIVVTSSYGITDTTTMVSVSPGALHHIGITPAGPETLYLEETATFYCKGYDSDGNIIDPLAADWSTTGTLPGTFGATSGVESLQYTTDGAGTGSVIATKGNLADTCLVTVLPYRVDSVAIWYNGSELTDANFTTDDDSTLLEVRGYDSTGAYLGLVSATWTIIGSGVGQLVPAGGGGMYFILTSPGTSMVVVNYQDRAYDTTGTIIVTPGALSIVELKPGQALVEMGDTVAFTVGQYDADHNPVTSPAAVSWVSTDHKGTFTPATRQYVSTAVGKDTLVVTAGGISDTSFITVYARIDRFEIRVDNTQPNLETAVNCTLLASNTTLGVVNEFTMNDNPIIVQPFIRELDGDSAGVSGTVILTADSLLPAGSAWYIPAGTPFTNGRFIFKLEYDVAGESLFVMCADTVRNVSGLSEAILYEDAGLMTEVKMYPSPINFNRGDRMQISYVLKYDSRVTVRIFSATGAFVWDKVYDKGDNGGRKWSNQIIWDGKSRHGNYVASGAYVIRIVVESDKGNTMQKRKVGVIGKRR